MHLHGLAVIAAQVGHGCFFYPFGRIPSPGLVSNQALRQVGLQIGYIGP
jgi:hypothetical protein